MDDINLVKEFYSAFKALDPERIAQLYSNEVKFEDPAFGPLHASRAKNMWRMLLGSQNEKSFKSESTILKKEGDYIFSELQAWYTFRKTGRRVHNIIQSRFKVENGKIVEHLDCFDLWRWSRHALGFKGILLGWSGFFKKKLQKQTNGMLDKFESSLENAV